MKKRITRCVVICLCVTISTAASAIEFRDTFDDGELRDDSPMTWRGSPSAVAGDLVLAGSGSGLIGSTADVGKSGTGWSMQGQARMDGSDYFGFMADAGNVGGSFSNGWSMLDVNGNVYVGSVFATYESVSTNLRPTREDVLIQMDSFDDLFQIWAWRPGEPRPEEPLLERTVSLAGDSEPTLWVRDPSGGRTEVHFRWLHVSDERSLPAPPTGDFDQDGAIGVADLDLLSAEIQAGTNDTDFDFTFDGVVDAVDWRHFVKDQLQTWFGDSDLSGAFDSSDLASAFAAGQYEDGVASNSTWATGDWNADGEFDSSDLITALDDGGYDLGPRAAVQAVPEPSTLCLLLTSLLLAAGGVSRRHRAVRGVSRL